MLHHRHSSPSPSIAHIYLAVAISHHHLAPCRRPLDSRRKRKAHCILCAAPSPHDSRWAIEILPASSPALHGIAQCPSSSCLIILCAHFDVPRPGFAALGRRRGRENAPRGTGLLACTSTRSNTLHRTFARPSPILSCPSTPRLACHHRAAADQHGPLSARHHRVVKVLRPNL